MNNKSIFVILFLSASLTGASVFGADDRPLTRTEGILDTSWNYGSNGVQVYLTVASGGIGLEIREPLKSQLKALQGKAAVIYRDQDLNVVKIEIPTQQDVITGVFRSNVQMPGGAHIGYEVKASDGVAYELLANLRLLWMLEGYNKQKIKIYGVKTFFPPDGERQRPAIMVEGWEEVED